MSKAFSSENIIELKGVSQRYKIGMHVIDAISDINITVHPNEYIMIMGPSGSGKSTLLNTIAGLEIPSAGNVKVFGDDLQTLSDRQLCEIRRHKLGFIFQFFNLHPILTAQENVELPMLIANVKRSQREIRARELLDLVNLDRRVNHHPHELSGGEKQRVGIARALANDPTIILADEPTGDMDSVTGHEIMALITKLNQEHNKTILCVTHDEEMLKPGMRLLRMDDGRIISDTNL
ncbi:MAG: ABC transporter ATP-binding protein [Candidatus Hodarchaeales archaeon]|jgi:putative ABC transport system ATP-binding protein